MCDQVSFVLTTFFDRFEFLWCSTVLRSWSSLPDDLIVFSLFQSSSIFVFVLFISFPWRVFSQKQKNRNWSRIRPNHHHPVSNYLFLMLPRTQSETLIYASNFWTENDGDAANEAGCRFNEHSIACKYKCKCFPSLQKKARRNFLQPTRD